MKKTLAFLVVSIFTLCMASSSFAGGDCPQPRKTKAAPSNIGGSDNTGSADKANGKALFDKTAKPMACKMCHGDAGAGDGKLGKALKPAPRNFACAETMKDVSAGQMFFVIKNGSTGTGMAPMKLSDKEIWDVVKYIREDLMK